MTVWQRSLLFIVFATLVSAQCACGATERPTINVAIGMTTDELESGSTFPFKMTVLAPAPASPVWVITKPYDLTYQYKGHELKQEDIGGGNYLIALTASRPANKLIDHIQITYQNQPLTLDEALTTAQKLQTWFMQAGFHVHPAKEPEPEPGRVDGPFHVDRQEFKAPKYGAAIRNYGDARSALLDPQAKIISLEPFSLETDDAYVGVEIDNGRRMLENSGSDKDESQSAVERRYQVVLYISARPTTRYQDLSASFLSTHQ